MLYVNVLLLVIQWSVASFTILDSSQDLKVGARVSCTEF